MGSIFSSKFSVSAPPPGFAGHLPMNGEGT
jgi:hypothetical protein